MKKLFFTAAVLAAGFCTSASAEIRIGATLSVTGPAPFIGDPQLKTLELLVEELNAKGGINGEKVRLIAYDDVGDPNKARTFATRLVEDDEVVAIIGGSLTGASMAVLAVTEDAEIPFISLAGAIDIIDPVKPFTFKTPHTDRMACQKIYEDMKARGFTKVGLVSGTDGFGASMEAQCKAVAKDYGIEIVADETYGPGDADMTAQLTKVKGTPGIQAIVNPGFGQSAIVLARNYRQLAIDLPFYASHSMASQGFIDLAGAEAVEGVRLPGTALLIADSLTDADVQKSVVTAYKTAFESKYSLPVGPYGGYAHDAFMILVDAIGRAGSTEPEAIRDGIQSTSALAGTTGIYSYSADDHLGLDLSAFRMIEIESGKWVLAK